MCYIKCSDISTSNQSYLQARHYSHIEKMSNKTADCAKISRLSHHGSASNSLVLVAARVALQRRQLCRTISKPKRQQRHCAKNSDALALPPGNAIQILYPFVYDHPLRNTHDGFSVAEPIRLDHMIDNLNLQIFMRL